MDNAINAVLNFLAGTGIKWAQAIIVLLVGLFVIKKIASIVSFALIKTTNNKTMATFMVSILNVVLTLFLVIVAFNLFGISTSGLMELLSACVIAIGLSLKDSVSHLASGLIIVGTKPFKVGDLVNAGGVEGTVKAVHMFSTKIKTGDNKMITVPNSSIVGSNITNYDTLAIRRMDIVVSVAYGSDIEACKKLLVQTAQNTAGVLKTPDVSIFLSEMADSGLNFTLRAWARSGNFASTKNAVLENVYLALTQNNIEIPYNTIDLNFRNGNLNVVSGQNGEVK